MEGYSRSRVVFRCQSREGDRKDGVNRATGLGTLASFVPMLQGLGTEFFSFHIQLPSLSCRVRWSPFTVLLLDKIKDPLERWCRFFLTFFEGLEVLVTTVQKVQLDLCLNRSGFYSKRIEVVPYNQIPSFLVIQRYPFYHIMAGCDKSLSTSISHDPAPKSVTVLTCRVRSNSRIRGGWGCTTPSSNSIAIESFSGRPFPLTTSSFQGIRNRGASIFQGSYCSMTLEKSAKSRAE